MRRPLAPSGVTPGHAPEARATSSVACIAFVLLLAAAFWAGAVWIGQFLLRVFY